MSEVKYTFSLQDLVSGKLDSLDKKGKEATRTFDKLDSTVSSFGKGLALIGGGAAAFAFAKNVAMTTARFQSMGNAIKFASDSSAHGEVSLQWLRDMSDKYGMPIEELTGGFKTFQGAMMDTKFTGDQVRDMFSQVSKGAVTMGLSAEDQQGVFLALGQIMGKGKVQAEELRGQIGERIPGAFKIAAKAMNMTTAELDKFMSDGKLMAEDFLPKFAAEMERTFGEGAEKNLDNMNASIVRAENSWTNYITALGNSQGIIKATTDLFSKGMNVATEMIKGNEGLSKDQGARYAGKDISAIEKQFQNQQKMMASSGSTPDQVREQLTKEAEFKIAELKERIARNEKVIPAMQTQLVGKQFADSHDAKSYYDDMMKVMSRTESYKLVIKALETIPDKLVARSYMKPNTALEAKTAKTKTTKDSERVRGVKHIIINIGKLVETQNIQVADLNTLGFKIKELVSKELLTAVNDVNIVAGR